MGGARASKRDENKGGSGGFACPERAHEVERIFSSSYKFHGLGRGHSGRIGNGAEAGVVLPIRSFAGGGREDPAPPSLHWRADNPVTNDPWFDTLPQFHWGSRNLFLIKDSLAYVFHYTFSQWLGLYCNSHYGNLKIT